MSTTAYDHHDIDCSQSPFFSVRSSTYRPLRTAILVSNVLRGRLSGFIAVGGGGEAHTLPKGRPINLILIPRLQSWTKSVKNFALSYSQKTHPANMAPCDPSPSPPTPPWSVLFSPQQKCFGHTSTLFFWGGGGSILSEPGFRGKYFKIRLTRCLFLNIFVQDCRLVTGAGWPSARAGARFLPSLGKIGK